VIVDLHQRPRIGPYILTRDLGPTVAFGGPAISRHDHAATAPAFVRHQSPSARPQPDRFLALHESNQTSHVAYRFPPTGGKAEEARLVAAVESASLIDHPHALRIQQFTFDITGQAWVITPYAGDADGLRTLTRHLRQKGGQCKPDEAERAIHQLLRVVAMAHGGGALQPPTPPTGSDAAAPTRAVPCHGPITMDEILVDRRGSLLIELYGLARALDQAGRPTLEGLRDEIRSIVEIGYQLITGLRAEEPLIPAGRLVRKLDARWDRWLDRGLDPSAGFDSAEAALAALPSVAPAIPSPIITRGLTSRFGTPRA
jgi:hypothetical protein